MRKQLPKVLLYAALLLAVFITQQQLADMPLRHVAPQGGVVDLSGLELGNELARIIERDWEYYPGHLYAPEDFARGSVVGPLFGDNAGQAEYGTYRLRVRLPEKTLYSMTGRSFHFSQRVYIGGRLVAEVGRPGTNRAETVPSSRPYEYVFLAEGEPVELIFQVANFHHRQSARNTSVNLAEPQVVDRFRALEFIRTNLVVGCLITVFFHVLGMFIFFPRRAYFLFLGLACLATAARMTLVGGKHLMEVFPGLSWFWAMRLEYLCLILFVVFLLLYFAALYPGMLRRWFIALIVGLSAAYAAIVLVGDTVFFTRMLSWYTLVWALASVVTLWKMLRQLRRGDMRATLIFIGLMAFVGTAAFDEISYRLFFGERVFHTLIAGVLVCVFMNLLALTLDFSETEGALVKARARQRELDENNRLLDRLSAMKTRFMANISHEMKTPLTVMSVHAQLTKALLAAGAEQGEMERSLDTISRESARLARMVEGVLDLGGMQESRERMETFDLGALLQTCGEAYRLLIEKRGNTLDMDIAGSLPVHGNADMLSQVVFNLLTNANRHTEGGHIALAAQAVSGDIIVSVRDTGSGITPDLLPHIFERRVHEPGSGETGLGLPLCRSILEKHGGTIDITSVQGGGTVVRVILPPAQQGEHHDGA